MSTAGSHVNHVVGILTYRFPEVKKASDVAEMPTVFRVIDEHTHRACAIMSPNRDGNLSLPYLRDLLSIAVVQASG